jgi:ribosomal protein S20
VTAARAALPSAQRALDRTARRNIIHPRTAARYKARLAHAITKITPTA